MRIFIFIIALFAAVPCFSKAPDPNFTPGREIPIPIVSKHIDGNSIKVFIPADYNSAQSWPAVFYYHGAGEQPSTQPVLKITGPDKFIIIAMEFAPLAEKADRPAFVNYLRQEQSNLTSVKLYLSKHLNIDSRRMILAGVSRGGWLVSNLADINPKPWAGIVILAAGRNGITYTKKEIASKPIYIGAGENDQNLDAAKKARVHYEMLHADTTFESYPSLGHTFDPNAPRLQAFFNQFQSPKSKTKTK